METRNSLRSPLACPLCEQRSLTLAYRERNTKALSTHAFASRGKPSLCYPNYFLCRACDLLFSAAGETVDLFQMRTRSALPVDTALSAAAAKSYAGFCKEHVMPLFAEIDTVLDIGCSDGSFLKEMASMGVKKCIGVEIHSDALKKIPEGIKVEQTIPLDRYEFALVTSFQTLEHLPSVLNTVFDAYQALRPGGVFLTVCHNHRSLASRLLGRYSPLLDAQHFQIFSPVALRSLFKKTGFSRVSIQNFSNTYPLRYWLNLVLPWLEIKRLRFLDLPLSLKAGNIVAVAIK